MRARFAAAFVVAFCGFAAGACKGITTPSNNTTQSFPGTLNPGSSASHPFSVSKTGEFSVTLTAWGPNTNLLVGLAWTVGNNDGSCTTSVLQQNNFSTPNTQALGGQIVSGKYCVFIFDVGTLTAPQTYTISVSHP
jgi:hypothetical protein